jgi:hypothetical protein
MSAGVYRTDDLALATALSMAGFKYELIKVAERKCVWDFVYTDDNSDDFDALLDEYWEYKHRVDPRLFVLRWAEMRREIFELVPAARRTVHPAPAA